MDPHQINLEHRNIFIPPIYLYTSSGLRWHNVLIWASYFTAPAHWMGTKITRSTSETGQVFRPASIFFRLKYVSRFCARLENAICIVCQLVTFHVLQGSMSCLVNKTLWPICCKNLYKWSLKKYSKGLFQSSRHTSAFLTYSLAYFFNSMRYKKTGQWLREASSSDRTLNGILVALKGLRSFVPITTLNRRKERKPRPIRPLVVVVFLEHGAHFLSIADELQERLQGHFSPTSRWQLSSHH